MRTRTQSGGTPLGTLPRVVYSCIQGTELIPQLSGKDVITSARLLSGGERLVNTPASIAERAVKSSIMYGLP